MPQIHTLLSSLLLVLQLCTQHNSKTHRVAATGMRPASHSTEPTHTLRKIPNQTHAVGCAVAGCCTCSPSVKTAQTVQLCKAPACLSLAVRSRPVGKLRYNQSPLCMHVGYGLATVHAEESATVPCHGTYTAPWDKHQWLRRLAEKHQWAPSASTKLTPPVSPLFASHTRSGPATHIRVLGTHALETCAAGVAE